MLDLKKIKWVFFDFGGCLDSDGLHSRTLFFNAFLKHGLVTPQQRAHFQEGYTYSDQKVISQGLIKSAPLHEMNMLMTHFIFKFLAYPLNQDIIQKVADDITLPQGQALRRNYHYLEQLCQMYQLGIISNFSGNLEVILEEFNLRNFFKVVCDSYYVGASKPDKKIFTHALTRAQCPAANALFIGDNPDRDILPAHEMGMQTVLITGENKTSDYADACLTSFAAFFELIQIK